jgi:nucleotide-binding universal stress UspA family protein
MKLEAELAVSALLTRLEKIEIRARALLLTGTTSIDAQILRAAKAEQTDLIIVGAPCRTGLASFLAGNVAARLIARSHCPVLVVPDEQHCTDPIYQR